MTRWVIDASVLIKLFINEQGSQEAAAAIKDADELLAPDLLWPEVGNVIWKYVRRGHLNAEDAEAIVSDMLQMPIETAESREFIEPALAIALSTGRTVYDSLYLALAIDRKSALLTADQKFAATLAKTPYAKSIRSVGQVT